MSDWNKNPSDIDENTDREDRAYAEMRTENELNDLAATYLKLRAEKFKREGELNFIEEQLEEVTQNMNGMLEALERTKFDFRGKLLYQHVDNYPKIRPSEDQALFAWLDEHGEGGIAKRTIHNKTLPKWYRDNVVGDKKKKTPPMHPEWEEELVAFLETFQKITINVQGDDRDNQKAAAYEEFKERWK